MSELLKEGDVLEGDLGKYFGRALTDRKRVEASGVDWVAVRDEAGAVAIATNKEVDGKTSIHDALAEFVVRGAGGEK